jgi:hypothetical protein
MTDSTMKLLHAWNMAFPLLETLALPVGRWSRAPGPVQHLPSITAPALRLPAAAPAGGRRLHWVMRRRDRQGRGIDLPAV